MIAINKFYKLISLIVLFMLPGYSMGATFISADADVEILLINGSAPEITRTVDNEFSLQAGVNQLLIRYAAEIKSGNEEEFLHSDVFVISFRADSSTLLLRAPTLQTQQDLQNFNRIGAWKLTKTTGESVLYAAEALKKTGFQLNRDFQAELAAFNRGHSPAALSATLTTAGPAKTQTAQRPNNHRTTQSSGSLDTDNLAANMALSNLKYWYQHADSHTRKQFLRWLNNQ